MQQPDTKGRKLFIGGLNHDTVEATLGGYFEQWGEVIDCVIMKDSMGRSRGFGFITYKEPHQLQNAQRNTKHVIDNKEVDAKLAVPKDFEQVDTSREQFRKLFVGGLNYDTTVDGLRAYFGQFGEVVECNVMRDGEGRSRGFGFVTYSDMSQLDEAQKKRPHLIDGKEVETKRAMPKDMNSGDNNITVKKMFVGGLKEDTTEEMIRQVFSNYGSIEDVDILKDKSNGRPRGFCFVVFTDYDSVDRAVLKKRHELNGSSVEVRKAVGKDQMASRGPGPASQRYGNARDRWMDGPPRNFSNRGGRFDRGDGNNNFGGRGGYNNFGGRGGYNNFGGRGGYGNFEGRGGYNDNFDGPSGNRRGGFNNFGNGGGNFGNFGGEGGNFGNFGGEGGNFGNFGGGEGNFGRGGSNFGNPGRGGGNYGNSGGGGGNYGNSGRGGGNFGNSGRGGGNSGGGGGNFGNSGGGGYGNSGSGGYGNSGSDGYGNSGSGGYGNSGSGGYSGFSGDAGAYGGSSGGGGSNNFGNPSGDNSGYGGTSDSGISGSYQQQSWAASGDYGNNSGSWGGNAGSGGFGNYSSGYSGGPVKPSDGISARSQGPYGAGYGSSGGSSSGTNNRGGGGSMGAGC